ncbi:actin-binding Rho-activating protein [Scaptodrosophila lebanonensis]|uniref:Actin-binding Rho-activating protein n=1 Tax=Drosophila lebanonensis TaxID=7225 RepID=A0A6J2TCK3_DROLE|nr:actin-binding Rho-activating protein [Scaptodrosophila lebanonensis]
MSRMEPESCSSEEHSVSSRITLFNQHVEQHQHWQQINPFSHYNVRDIPKRYFLKEEYGRAPSGSRSEQRALRAQVQSLEEILKLCEVINTSGNCDGEELDAKKVAASLKFGTLFELYNTISDKLLGTLLRARKYNYVIFDGETLFQGRDDAVLVKLQRPFHDLRAEIVSKIENLRLIETVKETEQPALRNTHFS